MLLWRDRGGKGLKPLVYDGGSKPRRGGGLLDTVSWVNTWDPNHREMVVHVRSGWRRRILITPRHRY